MGVSWSDDMANNTKTERRALVKDDYDRIERRAAAPQRYGLVLLCAAVISAVSVVLGAWLLG